MMDRLFSAARAFRVPVAAGSLIALSYAAHTYWPLAWDAAPRRAPAYATAAKDDFAAGLGYPPTLLRLPDEIRPVALTFTPPLPELSELERPHAAEPSLGNQTMPAGQDAPLLSVLRRMPPVVESPSSDSNHAEVPTMPRWQDEPSLMDGPWYDETPPNLHRLPAVSDSSNELDEPATADAVESDTMQSDEVALPALDWPEIPPVCENESSRPAQPAIQPRKEIDDRTYKPDAWPAPAPALQPESGIEPVREETHTRPSSVESGNSRDAGAAMIAVAQRADALTRHGFSLAERGAYYSARADFIQSLRLISQALDVQAGGQSHSQALADGLQALKEADDFAPKGSRLEADLDLAIIVSGHRTPVLKESDLAQATPLQALQRYYTYAQERLSASGGHQPAASMALYGLGRLHMAWSEQSADAQKLNGPKAMALHQAALLVDGNNYRAANELGVLLVRYGQFEDARTVLLHGVAISRQADGWHNLSVVHERLGETDLARRARYEYQLAADGSRAVATNASGAAAEIQWVSPEVFSGPSPTPAVAGPQQQPEKKDKTAWWFPWQQTTR